MTSFSLGKVKVDTSAYGSQGSAVLGIRDSGKTYTATELAEHLFEGGIPFIAFDPIGVWRYLRVPGKGRGYPVVVAGGQAGDLPLTVASAPEYVRAAMRDGVSLVIDLFDINLSKADWKRIVTACVRVLLHENSAHGLRHVFIEEAAEFAPQRVGPDQGQVYAEIEKLARMGGNSRLGYTLINQRAEEVNKAVLELCDNLFLHRQKGRNSLTALSKWLDIGNVKDGKEIIDSLSTLPTGECWAWLAGTERPVRVKVPAKNSLHPDRRVMRGDGDAKAKPPVDVGSFVSAMRSSLGKIEEQAKANDPVALKAQIRELERQVKASPSAGPTPVELRKAVDAAAVEAFNDGRLAGRKNGAQDAFGKARSIIEAHARQCMEALEAARKEHWAAEIDGESTMKRVAALDKRTSAPVSRVNAATPMRVAQRPTASGDGSLPKGEVAVLSACIQFPDGLRREQLTVLTGYKRSTRDAYIQRLREKGFVSGDGDRITATDEGIAALPDAQPLPTGEALQEYWFERLPDGERKILRVLVDHRGAPVSRDKLTDETNYKRSTRDAYLQRLSAKQLVSEASRGEVMASRELFG